MSTPLNFYRSGRYNRTVFREGRYLLNTEAMELQLETLSNIRDQISKVFGAYSAVENAVKVEIDPSDSQRIIIRPGEFFLDSYSLKIQSGTDHLVKLGTSPTEIEATDFIKVENDGSDVGGYAINFGGASVALAGTYSVVISVEEELITPANDPYLRSANLNEDTADKHRIILNINLVESSKLNLSPIPYVGASQENLVNETVVTRTATNYGIVNSTPISGSEAIDGGNLEIEINNGNGTTTSALPTANVDLEEYIHGKLIDSNGLRYHITNMYVTPGNSSTITMRLDLEKTRPVTPATNQDTPTLSVGVPYRLVKKDLYTTSSAQLPTGKRYWEVGQVAWDGGAFTSITDLRYNVLARDGVLAQLRESGLNISSDGEFSWDSTVDGGTLSWSDTIQFHSTFDSFSWTIGAGNTFSLFGSGLATNEVLYINLDDAPEGGSIPLKKGLRGIGDLALKGNNAHRIVWLAKRLSDDRIYFYNGMVLNDKSIGTIYDPVPERKLPEDVSTMGYKAMFLDELDDESAVNTGASTGFFFADSYTIQYNNRVINVSGNTISVGSAPSFTLQVGDAIVQNGKYQLITGVNSPSSWEVADGSVFTDSQNATLSQVVETNNLRATADDVKGRIDTYFSDNVEDALIVYDDGVVPITANPVKLGHSLTADGSDYSDVASRQLSLNDIETITTAPTAGTDVRLRFFAIDTTTDGSATLESFRVYMHKRQFVGTLLAAVATTASTPAGAGEGIQPPSGGLTNNTGGALITGRAVSIGPTGLTYADATVIASATSMIGVLTDTLLDGANAEDIVGSGFAPGVLTGLGFNPGDEVFLGTNGQLIDKTAALALPGGSAVKEVGIAYSTTDLWVHFGALEIV